MGKLLSSDAFWEALIEAGVVQRGDATRRIVIDAQVRENVVIYVERFGDERLLSVIPTLTGIEIKREDPS